MIFADIGLVSGQPEWADFFWIIAAVLCLLAAGPLLYDKKFLAAFPLLAWMFISLGLFVS